MLTVIYNCILQAHLTKDAVLTQNGIRSKVKKQFEINMNSIFLIYLSPGDVILRLNDEQHISIWLYIIATEE